MRISDWSSDVCSSDLLAQCPTVALSWRTDRHDAVVVACSGPNWRIFVPVHHAAPVTVAAANAAVAVAPPVKQQPVIKRGDPIVVAAGSPGFSISREAIAMGNAAPGARFLAKGRSEEHTSEIQSLMRHSYA